MTRNTKLVENPEVKTRTRSEVAPEQILTTTQAAGLLGVTRRFLERRRLSGDGPRTIKYSSRCVRYLLADVISWRDKHHDKPIRSDMTS